MPALLQRRNVVLPARPVTPLTALPQQSDLIARWSADAIPAQADDTALSSWTDAVGGLAVAQASGAAQPRYRTGGASGKPYVLFAGAQYMNVGNATNAVAQLLQNADAGSTSFVVYRNVEATSYGFLFSASVSTGYNLFDNGAQAGLFANARADRAIGAGLRTIAATKGAGGAISRVYLDNSAVAFASFTANGGEDVWIGGTTVGGTQSKAEIYEVLVWNRALTAAEVMQVEQWARDKYAQPYPWAGGPFRVFHGDSLTAGYMSSGPLAAYPARVAAANGWSFGQWTNLGHSGAAMTDLKTEAVADIDPMVALLGATPLHLAAWEWYNQQNQSTADATSATQTYFQARRAAGVAKLVLLSSTDAADPLDKPSSRAAYNGWLDANAGPWCDVYVPLHQSTANGGVSEIGPEGACPNASPWGPYFADGIHLTDAGYQALADRIAPVMA